MVCAYGSNVSGGDGDVDACDICDSGSVSGCGMEGVYVTVVQWVRHWAHDRKVVSSSPQHTQVDLV